MPSFPTRVGLMIAVPHSGQPIVPDWGWCLANLHPPMNFNTRYANIMFQPVDVARNWLAEQAKLQQCKYLMFLGDDVTCPHHSLRQLIYFMEHHPDCAVAGAIYCWKAHPAQPLVFRGNGAGAYWDWKIGEVFEVSGIGMDCTLIRTSALETISKPYFKTVDDASGFLENINKAEIWTEDLYFCHKIVEAVNPETRNPWQVFADGSLLCKHWDAPSHTAYELPPDSKPMQVTASQGKKIVDLGCGPNKYKTDEGKVIGVDIREFPGVTDYRCDLRCLPFGTEEFDVVYSSHTLEHFPRTETESTLDEWIRILKKDGELRLVLPNLEWAAKQLLTGDLDTVSPHTGYPVSTDVYNVLYGSQEYKQNFHMNGFTPKLVRELLSNRGFSDIKIDDSQYYNLIVQARRMPQGSKTETSPAIPPETRLADAIDQASVRLVNQIISN